MNFSKNPKMIVNVIRSIQQADSKKEKIDILKKSDTVPLRTFLRLIFDSRVSHTLPEGVPEDCFAGWPEGEAPANLNTIYRNYVNFLEGAPGTQLQKEAIFLKLLSKLCKSEAEILIEAKDKKLKLGLSKREISKVFPGIFG